MAKIVISRCIRSRSMTGFSTISRMPTFRIEKDDTKLLKSTLYEKTKITTHTKTKEELAEDLNCLKQVKTM